MNKDTPSCLYYFTNGRAFGTVSYSSLTIYVLKYYVDGLEYSFVSFDDQGIGTEQFIALRQKQ